MAIRSMNIQNLMLEIQGSIQSCHWITSVSPDTERYAWKLLEKYDYEWKKKEILKSTYFEALHSKMYVSRLPRSLFSLISFLAGWSGFTCYERTLASYLIKDEIAESHG
jgi:hypothetical protein